MAFTPNDVERMARAYTKAWSAGDPAAVVSFCTENGEISINRGDLIVGRAALQEMVAGFYADVPGLALTMDQLRVAGTHAIYLWTFEGNHSETGNPVKVSGWEEWELIKDPSGNLKIASSRGWYDVEDYDRQVAGT